MSSSTQAPLTLKIDDWDVSSVKYMQPRVSDRGAKSVNIVSTQLSRALHLQTPPMMTWGISDYTNEHGESDGKFSMNLNFPNSDYEKPQTTAFLKKFKEFEEKILDDAVKYSEAWFGEEMSREVAKHTFFPCLKYPKDKNTKKFDYTRSPAIKLRVPCYNGKWNVQVYDINKMDEPLFPNDNPNLTPIDFVPKQSNVACVIQCGGLWFGGKGWGITWRLVQAVVKPHQVESIFSKCHIELPKDEMEAIENQASAAVTTTSEVAVEEEETVETEVADSDEEEEEEEEEEDEVVEEVKPPPKKTTKKKVVEESVVEESVVEESVVDEAPPVKKKAVRKKKDAA